MGYGQGYYDFDEGGMIFTAPLQIIESHNNTNYTGYTMFIHGRNAQKVEEKRRELGIDHLEHFEGPYDLLVDANFFQPGFPTGVYV